MGDKITRRQAWMKLAVLIADGLPDPQEIDFHSQIDLISMGVDSVADLEAWMSPLGLKRDATIRAHDGGWIHGASGDWLGYRVRIVAVVPDSPDPVETTENLTAIRALADEGETCVCCSPGDCGDRRGHVAYDDPEGGRRCNCGREWPCAELAGA